MRNMLEVAVARGVTGLGGFPEDRGAYRTPGPPLDLGPNGPRDTGTLSPPPPARPTGGRAVMLFIQISQEDTSRV